MHMQMDVRHKVLLVELNEINWRVVDRLIAQRGEDFLPNFRRLRQQGAWAVQSAVERRRCSIPGSPGSRCTPACRRRCMAPRCWSSPPIRSRRRGWHPRAAEAGRRVGVFGSISAYPPPPLDGFVVPGPFAPSDATWPSRLEPVQAINRRPTQVHNRTTRAPTLAENAATGLALLRMGLSLSTMAHVARLVGERLGSAERWRRVLLQPRLNWDIFSALYRRERPDFATWHSNHAALHAPLLACLG